ncbi:hypothetical protein [Armatimonas sp.]|uniref:hypothetical protein n=1 Tax=Armatimonas sp. TaxID=1872638 RepID=UPI00374D722C
MSSKKHTLVVLAVAALSAPLFSTPVHGVAPRAAEVVTLPPPAWTVYVLVGGVPVDVTDSASHGEGHVYIDGVLLGDIAPDGSILDGNQVVVGFVVVEP